MTVTFPWEEARPMIDLTQPDGLPARPVVALRPATSLDDPDRPRRLLQRVLFLAIVGATACASFASLAQA